MYSLADKGCIFLIIGVLCLLTCCDLDVPVDVLSSAKSSLSRAKEVKADKYAPAELESAEKFLYNSHNDLVKGDAEIAKRNAAQSLKFSEEAIKISLPLLSGDMLKESHKVYNEIVDLYAEKYAQAEFHQTEEFIKKAEELNSKKQYWNSYLISNDAAISANNAKEKCTAAIPDILKKVESMESELENIRNDDNQKKYFSDLDGITLKIKDIPGYFGQMKIKEGSLILDKLYEELKEIRKKVNKNIADDKIKAITDILVKLNNTNIKEKFSNDISKAEKSNSEGKLAYDAGNYDEAIKKFEEALDNLKKVNSSINLRKPESKKKK